MLYITDREVVASIKATTIPKLELTSAISTKVATLLQAELNIERKLSSGLMAARQIKNNPADDSRIITINIDKFLQKQR